jgi:hypothetical protein
MRGAIEKTSHTQSSLLKRAYALLGMVLLAGVMSSASVVLAPSIAHADTVNNKLFCSHPIRSDMGNREEVSVVQSFAQIDTGNGDTVSATEVIDAPAVINRIISTVTTDMDWRVPFNQIVGQIRGVVGAAVLLYIVIFGIMMVFNMVNLTWYEVFIRIAKVGAVYYLLFDGGVAVILHKFIFGGMNELIEAYYNATIGTLRAGGGGLTQPADNLTVLPLEFLITPVEKVFTLQFICSALAVCVAGAAGFGLGLFLIFGLFTFFMAIVGAIATYVKAVIALTILFAISPIFIACLIFEQTRRLFDGWLSMCLNFALQPVFVFAFLGFFMVMLNGALEPLTKIYWCYGPVVLLGNTDLSFFFPVPPEYFVGNSALPARELQVWLAPGIESSTPIFQKVKLDAKYGTTVKDLWNAAGVDLYVVDVMMFCLLSTLCWRYSEYTSQIAREIVGGGVSIAVTGQQISQQMENAGLTPQKMLEKATSGAQSLGNEVSSMVSNMMGARGADKMRDGMADIVNQSRRNE